MTWTGTNGVRTGADRLEETNFAPVRGRRVGLVTNHTGRTRDGRSLVQVLHQAPGVHLATLFSPEHGIAGRQDEQVGDTRDPVTGVPVFSLFGTRQAPAPEQMAGLDLLIFDIQDIGCRFYTYISTLRHVLEAAADAALPVLVLDRPNPITGQHLEGPCTDADRLSFVACHPLPVRHGLTIGEMARLLAAEKDLPIDLQVLPCAGWRRGDWFDATGLTWTPPSPNMRSLTAATLYPGIGLLEMTPLSVGRGTDTPFEVAGAPFIDGRALAAALNGAGLPGLRVLPVRFSPHASVYAGEECGGVQFLVTDREALAAVRTGITLAAALRDLFSDQWTGEKLMTLLVNRKTFEAFEGGATPDALAATWDEDIAAFTRRRQPHLLYAV